MNQALSVRRGLPDNRRREVRDCSGLLTKRFSAKCLVGSKRKVQKLSESLLLKLTKSWRTHTGRRTYSEHYSQRALQQTLNSINA